MAALPDATTAGSSAGQLETDTTVSSCAKLGTMSDSDGEAGEFVFYGSALTPSETTLPRRHEFQKTDVKDPSAMQNLPVWKQVHV